MVLFADELSEYALMCDLIYVFQDIEGKHICFDHKEDGFRIQPQASCVVCRENLTHPHPPPPSVLSVWCLFQ